MQILDPRSYTALAPGPALGKNLGHMYMCTSPTARRVCDEANTLPHVCPYTICPVSRKVTSRVPKYYAAGHYACVLRKETVFKIFCNETLATICNTYRKQKRAARNPQNQSSPDEHTCQGFAKVEEDLGRNRPDDGDKFRV